MNLFSYIVARDYGFAPNPFHGYCTLATCKPVIRSGALVGDWIIGTGAKKKYNLPGYLIYAMKVEETVSFEEYWNDQRFLCKRPVLNGSLKQLQGDNIYHRGPSGWIQADSHHSLADGRPNPGNMKHDTSVDRVLIATHFGYFGSNAIRIPAELRHPASSEKDICCATQGHRKFQDAAAKAFEAWFQALDRYGLQGMPLEFDRYRKQTNAS